MLHHSLFLVALEKLESIYKSCLVVNNLCVYGDSLRPKPVAIIVPIEPRIKELAEQFEIEGDLEHLCKSEVIRKEVLRLLLEQAKVGGLKGSELLHEVHVSRHNPVIPGCTALFYSHVCYFLAEP
jgi:long-chain acyl-CoA synthetase